jgi:hypothetical protein
MFWFCPDFWWRDMLVYFVFCILISRPTSLIDSNRVCVFYTMVFILSPSKLTSAAYNNSSCVLFQFETDLIFLHFPMSNVKSNGGRVSPCFRPFSIGSVSDK